MSYTYLTDEDAAERFGTYEALYQDCVVDDIMTATSLIDLSNITKGRFQFTATGMFADCIWVDYYRTDSGKLRLDNDTGSLTLKETQERRVVIQGV